MNPVNATTQGTPDLKKLWEIPMKKFASNKRSIHLLLVICTKQRDRFTYLDISSCMLFARYPQFQQRIHLRFLNPEVLRFPPDPLSFQAKARWNGICCCSDLNVLVDGRFQIWFLKFPWSPSSYWGWGCLPRGANMVFRSLSIITSLSDLAYGWRSRHDQRQLSRDSLFQVRQTRAALRRSFWERKENTSNQMSSGKESPWFLTRSFLLVDLADTSFEMIINFVREIVFQLK